MDPGVWQLQLAESLQHVPVIQLANVPIRQTLLLAPAPFTPTKQHVVKVVLVIAACVTMEMCNNKLREQHAVIL